MRESEGTAGSCAGGGPTRIRSGRPPIDAVTPRLSSAGRGTRTAPTLTPRANLRSAGLGRISRPSPGVGGVLAGLLLRWRRLSRTRDERHDTPGECQRNADDPGRDPAEYGDDEAAGLTCGCARSSVWGTKSLLAPLRRAPGSAYRDHLQPQGLDQGEDFLNTAVVVDLARDHRFGGHLGDIHPWEGGAHVLRQSACDAELVASPRHRALLGLSVHPPPGDVLAVGPLFRLGIGRTPP